MATIQRFLASLISIAILSLVSNPAASADKLGIFELIHEASGSYEETLAAVGSALKASIPEATINGR